MTATTGRVAASALLVLAMTIAGAIPGIGQPQTVVHSPVPRPDAVVEAGMVRVGATLEGQVSDARMLVDDVAVGIPTAEGVDVQLAPGTHQLAVHDGEVILRTWQVYVSGVRTTALAEDPVALAAAASGTSSASRAVLLVNPATPALSAAAGPLAVATRALLVPVDATQVSDAAIAAIAAVRAPGEEVMLLGGLDAISPAVADQLVDAGWTVRRIGTGSAADVAVAAAVHQPAADVYTRDGQPIPRPVLVGPDGPTVATLQAAAEAARRGASLLLVDGDGPSTATADVIAGRRVVILSDSLTDAARSAVLATTSADAVVRTAPQLPEAAKHVWIADGSRDPGTALLMTRAAGLGVAVLVDAADAPSWVGGNQPAGVMVPADGPSASTVGGWWVDGPAATSVDVVLVEGGPTQPLAVRTPVIELRAGTTVAGASVYVTVEGREWPGTTTIADDVVTWTAGPRPVLPGADEPTAPRLAPVRVTGVVTAEGHLRHAALDTDVVIGTATTTSPEGFVVAGGSSAVVGTGPLRTFSIEVEPGTGLDIAAVAAEATGILLDAQRGWTARGQRSMQRVGTSADADIRVVVATPATVDRYCRGVGLDTGGRLSCWDGRRAMLNLTRWTTGVSPFHTDLTVYRQYLVSHEVGHGLGMGHVGCPGSGQLAPVMMQQSKSLSSCIANGWPFPNG